MRDFQHEFIEFALDTGVLSFGDFVLKSGRQSPYFFNSGLFDSGASLARLGAFYARAILDSGLEFDMLYGAAYKGIPLVAAVSIALAEHHDRDVPWSFNRKEAKDHGEKGQTVGAPLQGRVLMVDDVISAGTSTRESVVIIRAAGAQPAGAVIALDRQERGNGATSAVQEVSREFKLTVVSVVALQQLTEYLADNTEMAPLLERMQAYRDRYGVVAI